MNTNKKLVEAALPLDAINTACAREESISPRAPEHASPVVSQAAAGGNGRAIVAQAPAAQIFTVHQLITGTGQILTPHEQKDGLG